MTIKTTNYHIHVKTTLASFYGYIEHVLYGDEKGGEIIVEDMCLVDYDGFSELPEEILDALEEQGLNVDDARV